MADNVNPNQKQPGVDGGPGCGKDDKMKEGGS